MSDVQIGQPKTLVVRTVEIPVSGVDVMRGHNGQKFRPQAAVLQWRNQSLHRCSLIGVRVREDGHDFLSGAKGGRSFIGDGEDGLDTKTPEWLRDLTYKYGRR